MKSKNHDYLGILDEIEDKEMTETGKRGLGLSDMKDLSDPQAGPDADGGERAGPADSDGSNDDDPTVRPGENAGDDQHQDDTDQAAGVSKLRDMVKTLSASDKATLRQILDEE